MSVKRTSTRSPTCKSRLSLPHFLLGLSDGNHSLSHLLQNRWTISWANVATSLWAYAVQYQQILTCNIVRQKMVRCKCFWIIYNGTLIGNRYRIHQPFSSYHCSHQLLISEISVTQHMKHGSSGCFNEYVMYTIKVWCQWMNFQTTSLFMLNSWHFFSSRLFTNSCNSPTKLVPLSDITCAINTLPVFVL